MIHFFSGLFGSDENWNAYQQLGENRVHAVTDDPKHIAPEDVLIGYSMGGRIALKLSSDLKFKIKKIILLSVHPGLDVSERPERKAWEDQILDKMDRLGQEKFLEYWDTLGIFSQSQVKKDLSEITFKTHRDCFNRFRLSQQKNYLSEMIQHHHKITYIYGKHDEKYAKLAQKLKDNSISCLEVDADHRVLLKPNLLLPLLQQELYP
jgi:pimeloyl-ACP methyl ester carboxylesterase